MKAQSLFTFRLMILGVILAIASIAFTGCAGLQTQHQKIAAACESIASGLDAATAAKQSGRISAAQLQQAVSAAKPTAGYCQPPAESLTASDYAALLAAAARIAASPGVAK